MYFTYTVFNTQNICSSFVKDDLSMHAYPPLPLLLALFGLAVAALLYQCAFRLACCLTVHPADWSRPAPAGPPPPP